MTVDPIKHVVLLMLENHSFDQMLGALQEVYPDLDGVDPRVQDPTSNVAPRFNLSLSGKRILQVPTDQLQVERDPQHETPNVLDQIANGNSGFVTDYERNVKRVTEEDMGYLMGYYALGRLPALHELGQNFTVCDRWYSSLPGPTWPNRFFALSGTSSGHVEMPSLARPDLEEFTAQKQETIFDRLNDAGRSWKLYFYDFPVALMLTRLRQPHNLAHFHLIKEFFEKDTRDESRFPDFAFIEPKYMGADQNDDHPPHNVLKAEKLIADVYNAIRANPALWMSTLLVVTYDEHGGFYDHVSPPPAIPPDDNKKEWTFDRYGVRVPALLVSPWVGARVEHTEFDHTSLLRYLQDKWQLGPLGERTAHANSIGVAINQDKPRSETVGFIRVPYTFLISAQPELEEADVSIHHQAIQRFAEFLAVDLGIATGTLIDELARAAGLWVRIKTVVARFIRKLARRLGGWFESNRTRGIEAVGQVARKAVEKGRMTEGPPPGGGQGG